MGVGNPRSRRGQWSGRRGSQLQLGVESHLGPLMVPIGSSEQGCGEGLCGPGLEWKGTLASERHSKIRGRSRRKRQRTAAIVAE